jgi:hypothetical protein
MTFYHVNRDNLSLVPRPLKDHSLAQPAILEDDHECLGLQPFEKLSGAHAPDDVPWHDILVGDPGWRPALALPETEDADASSSRPPGLSGATDTLLAHGHLIVVQDQQPKEIESCRLMSLRPAKPQQRSCTI